MTRFFLHRREVEPRRGDLLLPAFGLGLGALPSPHPRRSSDTAHLERLLAATRPAGCWPEPPVPDPTIPTDVANTTITDQPQPTHGGPQ